MRVAAVVAVCMLAAAGAARAAAADDHFTPPGWLKKPTRDDLLGVWPLAAVKQAINGRAVISCAVTLQGTLRDCDVASESPPGAGFGRAALALTPQLLFKPATEDGTPVESKINIPINFPKLDDETRAALSRRSVEHLGSRIPQGVNTAYYKFAVWDAAPTVADIVAAYPKKARAEKITGHATLDCGIARNRGLEDCRVITEFPRGEGFGAAARSLASKFRAPVVTGNAAPSAGTRTDLPFTFSPDTLTEGSPLIGKPQWSGTPTADDFTAAFPKAAATAGVLKARVVLSCLVTPAGGVTDCSTTSEDPPGLGFGSAAASLADKFRLTTWTGEGLPTAGGRVSIPIRYELQQAPPTTAQEGGAR